MKQFSCIFSIKTPYKHPPPEHTQKMGFTLFSTGEGNQVEKWEGWEGNQISGNFIHPWN